MNKKKNDYTFFKIYIKLVIDISMSTRDTKRYLGSKSFSEKI